jgi:hypothetical protein
MMQENEHILRSYARQKMAEAHHLAEAERLASLAETPLSRARSRMAAAAVLITFLVAAVAGLALL